jgi:hypothetical protein
MLFIVVDASTSPVYGMDKTNKQPSVKEATDVMSGVELHHYNAASITCLKPLCTIWGKSCPHQKIP